MLGIGYFLKIAKINPCCGFMSSRKWDKTPTPPPPKPSHSCSDLTHLKASTLKHVSKFVTTTM